MNNDDMNTKRQANDNEDDDTDLMRDLPDDHMESMQQSFSEEGDDKNNP